MGDVSFQFTQPAALMNLNDRGHWSTRARQEKAWRATAGWAALQLPKSWRPIPAGARLLVEVTLPVKRVGQRRDAHNFVATVKPIVDGLVDAKVVDDDDTTRVATMEPRFHAGDQVVVSLTLMT